MRAFRNGWIGLFVLVTLLTLASCSSSGGGGGGDTSNWDDMQWDKADWA